MDVRIAVLADYASLSEGSKLNILGIFTTIYSENVPTVHPQMKLVTSWEFNSSEAGTKNIKIELVDEDGKDILSINGEMRFERSPDGRSTTVNQILNLNNMVFPKFGEYEFRILIDGDTKSTVPLTVAQRSSPKTSSKE
jgi:hypothetical protein